MKKYISLMTATILVLCPFLVRVTPTLDDDVFLSRIKYIERKKQRIIPVKGLLFRAIDTKVNAEIVDDPALAMLAAWCCDEYKKMLDE